MKTFVSRTAFATLLAASVGVGFATLGSTAALAQASPANPNYSYDTRTQSNTWQGYAVASHVTHARSGLNARAEVISNGDYLGQDPDANVRLELRRDTGLFDR